MMRVPRSFIVVATRRVLPACLAITIVAGAGYRAASARGQAAPQDAANVLSLEARAQISALLAEKAALTPTQRKINSRLLHAKRRMTGETRVTFDVALPRSDSGKVQLELRAEVTDQLLAALAGLGVDVIATVASGQSVLVEADLLQIEPIAALPEVHYVGPKPGYLTSASGRSPATPPPVAVDVETLRERKARARAAVIESLRKTLAAGQISTNVGSKNSEGDTTHKAATARSTFGVDGRGVKVGVISDGVTSIATSVLAGDVGGVTVLPGQTGSGNEGIAMLEIVRDLAPAAQLFFATALPTPAQFAQNIRDLRTAGCDIIVDDVLYFVETPFQDGQTAPVISPTNAGVVIQAVKDVTAAGALYFSSAGNSGRKDAATSGTWEGDFVDGGDVGPPISDFEPGRLHVFGATAYNVVTSTTGPVTLHWSDPLGGSANDYDIFRLNSTGTTIFDASQDVQSGTQDPFEIMGPVPALDRIVIVKFDGVGRFLHLDTSRGQLTANTDGSTHGHSTTSSLPSFSVGATRAIPPGPYPGPFTSTNTAETFSSDGPRRIFFNANGSAITPGNFSSTGGVVLQKPDITAADCVSVTGAGGFPTTFCGTSAAAPHAAAIAALIKSAGPAVTANQVRNALLLSVIDIHAAGWDRNSGSGIVMADTGVFQVAPPLITVQPASQTIVANVMFLLNAASLSVTATGLAPLTYQWYLGPAGTFNPIGGATSSTYNTGPLNGQTSFWVAVSNPNGTRMSNTANISVTFTDPSSAVPTLTTGQSVILAAHITDLRNRINARRALAGQGPVIWAETLTAQVTTVKASHLNELRTAMTTLYTTVLGLPAPTYANPAGSIPAGSVIFLRTLHELRALMTAVQ